MMRPTGLAEKSSMKNSGDHRFAEMIEEAERDHSGVKIKMQNDQALSPIPISGSQFTTRELAGKQSNSISGTSPQMENRAMEAVGIDSNIVVLKQPFKGQQPNETTRGRFMSPQIVYTLQEGRSDADGTIKVSANSLGSTPKLAIKIGHS
jgi:hypothetical protein